MPYRPLAPHRKNVHAVIRPLTAAVHLVFGSREQDGARPIGAFYTINIDSTLWVPLGGIWYRPLDAQAIEARVLDPVLVRSFAAGVLSGSPLSLPSGEAVHWEAIPRDEAAQLPPPLSH